MANGQPLYPVPGGVPPGPVQPFTEKVSRSAKTVVGPSRKQKVETKDILDADRKHQEAIEAKALAAEREGIANEQLAKIEANAAAQAVTMRELAELRKQEADRESQERISARAAAEESARLEMEKDAKITDYWSDRSAPARILAAVLVGIGEGLHEGPGPSRVAQIYQGHIEADRKAKLDKLEASKLRYEGAKGKTAESEAARKADLTRIDNELITQTKILADYISAVGKKIPRATLAADKAAAEIRQIGAEKALAQKNQFAIEEESERVTRQSGGEERVVTGEKQGGAGGPTLQERQAVSSASAQKRAAENLRAVIEKNPEAMKAYSRKFAREQKRGAGGKVAAGLTGAARFIGFIPATLEDALTTQAERDIHAGLSEMVKTQLKRQDPQSAALMGEITAQLGSLAVGKRSPKEMLGIVDREIAEAERRERQFAPAPAPVPAPAPIAPPSFVPPAAPVTPAPPTRTGEERLKQAKVLLEGSARGRTLTSGGR